MQLRAALLCGHFAFVTRIIPRIRVARLPNYLEWFSSLGLNVGCTISAMGIPPVEHASRGRRIFLWLIFVGLVAVASPLVTSLIGYITGNAPGLSDLLAEGDGFLIAIAITADAIGRAVERRQADTLPAMMCALVFAAALLSFGVSKAQLLQHREDVERTMTSSSKLPAAEGLDQLVDVLKKAPFKQDRIALISEIMVGVGLAASFIIVVSQEN